LRYHSDEVARIVVDFNGDLTGIVMVRR